MNVMYCYEGWQSTTSLVFIHVKVLFQYRSLIFADTRHSSPIYFYSHEKHDNLLPPTRHVRILKDRILRALGVVKTSHRRRRRYQK